jgi:hypothetical protein
MERGEVANIPGQKWFLKRKNKEGGIVYLETLDRPPVIGYIKERYGGGYFNVLTCKPRLSLWENFEIKPEGRAKSIGARLRSAREVRSISLEEVYQAIKIPVKFLKVLEEGDFEALPAEVYARAFLRNYANFLGLDSDQLFQEYKELLEAAAPSPKTEVKSIRSKRRLFISMAVGLFILTVFIWSLSSYLVRHSSTRTAEVESLGSFREGMRLLAKVNETCWVEAMADGKRVEYSLLKPGEIRTWLAHKEFVIKAGNAGGIDLELDGKPVGPLGKRGEVVTKIFLREESDELSQ